MSWCAQAEKALEAEKAALLKEGQSLVSEGQSLLKVGNISSLSSDMSKLEQASGDIKQAEGCCKTAEKDVGNVGSELSDLEAQALKKLEASTMSATVNTEQVYFVVLYPDYQSLQKRAELDKMSIRVDEKQTLDAHENFYHENEGHTEG